MTSLGKALLKIQDVGKVISMLRKDTVQDGVRKLRHRIAAVYTGSSEKTIQDHINNEIPNTNNVRFTKRAAQKPIAAGRAMEINQADLVDLIHPKATL